jgi:hypothetical protein
MSTATEDHLYKKLQQVSKRCRELSAALRESEKRGFELSANQCLVENGVVGDAGGTPYCTIKRQLSITEDRLDKFASALAEKTIECERLKTALKLTISDVGDTNRELRAECERLRAAMSVQDKAAKNLVASADQ